MGSYFSSPYPAAPTGESWSQTMFRGVPQAPPGGSPGGARLMQAIMDAISSAGPAAAPISEAAAGAAAVPLALGIGGAGVLESMQAANLNLPTTMLERAGGLGYDAYKPQPAAPNPVRGMPSASVLGYIKQRFKDAHNELKQGNHSGYTTIINGMTEDLGRALGIHNKQAITSLYQAALAGSGGAEGFQYARGGPQGAPSAADLPRPPMAAGSAGGLGYGAYAGGMP